MNRETDFSQIADAVLAGEDLEWEVLKTAADPEARRVILQFRTIAQISEIRKRVDGAPLEWWGHLRIEEKLGVGAFGEVFRAWDSRLERQVALKLLRNDRDPTDILREARLLARIRHPNIVTVFDAGEFEGRAGFWMELLEGETLEHAVHTRGSFAAPDVLRLALELSGALGAVHAAGLLHKDIKAQNVIQTVEGRVVLMDFGAGDDFSSADSDSQQAGTPLYLAPEVLLGGTATPRSDIYSLGVLLFRLASRDYPILGGAIQEVRLLHNQGVRKNLSESAAGFPKGLARVIDRALEPDPAARFATAAAMESELRRLNGKSARRGLIPVAAAMLALTAVVVVGLTKRTPDSTAVRMTSPTVPPGKPEATPPQPQASIEPSPGPKVESPSSPMKPLLRFEMINSDLQRRVNFRTLADDGIHATCIRGLALAICNLNTGEIQEVRVARAGQGAGSAMLSPDLKRVVYDWSDGTSRSLRLISAEGHGDRELYRPPAGGDFSLMKWIRGGQAVLLTTVDGQPGTRHVAVAVDGGRSEELARFDASQVAPDVSPDERFVVFSRTAPGQSTLDIAIVDRRTGQESWLVRDSADDSRQRWTPDGRGIVFLSNRLGTSGLFFLPVHEGRAAGTARLVRDFGRSSVVPVNFARDGTLLLRMTTHWVDAYRATIDLENGAMETPQRLDPRSIEDTASPDWSPDGRLFAYLSGAASSPSSKARLVVRYYDGRLFRDLLMDGGMSKVAWMRWSPDSRYIALRYSIDSPSSVLFLIDVEAGSSRTALTGPSDDFRWNASGTAILFKGEQQIRQYDIASGEITTLLNIGIPFGFDISSRHGSIAVTTPVNKCSLSVLPPNTPFPARPLRHRFDGPCFAVAWSRDGRKLLVSINKGIEQPGELWVMDAASGEPIRIDVPTTEAISSLSLSPDDRELLFSAGNPRPEWWLLSGADAARTGDLEPAQPVRVSLP